MTRLPVDLWLPQPPFQQDYARAASRGWRILADSDVAIVGLARNCAEHLSSNLQRLLELVERCGRWRLHIETNDNDDGTDQVLADFCAEWRQATFTSQRLGRPQLSSEFAGRRTEALAEYRTACQSWVRDTCPACDCVVVIDFDAWGGWNQDGLAHGVASLEETPDAAGMASVSLMQHPAYVEVAGSVRPGVAWMHYDAWALRLNSSWDDYSAGKGGWKHQWLPPVGSPPVPVCSAFGGLAVYRTQDYLHGVYDGSDCEHVTFHESMAAGTRRQMYLNPSQRCVMRWVDGGQHGND